MQKNLKFIWFLTLFAFIGLFNGCLHSNYTLTKKTTIEQRIEAVRLETKTKLESLRNNEIGLLKQQLDTYQGQVQETADALFKGQIVFQGINLPTRPELIMGYSIEKAALFLPPASVRVQQKTFTELKTELDETKISAINLKAQYEKELNNVREEAQQRQIENEKIKASLVTIESEKTKAVQEGSEKERNLQEARDKLSKETIAKQNKEIEEAKHNEKIKIWLIGVLLIAAAGCGVGAIYLPMPGLKGKLLLVSLVCGAAALVIIYIEPWMVMVGVGALLLIVALFILKDYHKEYSTATNVYRGIEEIKNKSEEEYNHIVRPVLTSWNTKIDGKTGQTVPDTTAIAHIDNRLIQVGDK